MLRVIGSGSFGEVFEGIDVISNLKVAIKLEPTGRDSPSLLYEARILRLLQNRGSGIPRLYHTGQEGSYNIMVT